MVVKKKRTYKKQKGGEPITNVDKIMIQFFDLIKTFIINNSVVINKDNIIKLCNYINEKMKYSLFVKLSIYLNGIIDVIDTNTHDMFSLQLVKYLLVEPEISDNFINKVLKLYIHLLFIQYLFNEDNYLFKNKILTLLQQSNENNKIIASLLIMSNDLNSSPPLYIAELERQLRNLFLNDYSKEYGIPVFYGNTLDSNHNITRNLGYNQFICEKVGVSSKDKRNYIINPVGALAWKYIDKINYLNTPLYDLLRKILRFDYVQGNKRQDSFNKLPKLNKLRQTTKFCIAIDNFNNEKVYKESTDNLSKCLKLYGCSLKMTAEIRRENIASDEHIRELLSILLEIKLDKPVSHDIFNRIEANVIPQINQIQPSNNRRRNGLALTPNQEFGPEIRLITRQNNKIRNGSALTPNSRKLSTVKVCREESECNQGNFSLYNKITAKELLEKKYYMMVLHKLYKEASKLIRKKTPYNLSDIQKRKKLLEIIDLIQINPQTRLNINHNLVRNL